jgi:hypothetical protein
VFDRNRIDTSERTACVLTDTHRARWQRAGRGRGVNHVDLKARVIQTLNRGKPGRDSGGPAGRHCDPTPARGARRRYQGIKVIKGSLTDDAGVGMHRHFNG